MFGLGAALAGLAGLMHAPMLTVQIGMGENILILAFVVIVIGGIGSIRGAFLAAILVGLIDTLGRAFLPDLLRMVLSPAAASTAAPALSSMLIYLLMAIVLVVRPEGLFPARADDRVAQRAHVVTALLVAGLLLLPVYAALSRQRLRADAVHAHADLRAGRQQPQPDPRLWRHGQLRPCRLLGIGGYAVGILAPTASPRLRAVAGGAGGLARCSRSAIGSLSPAHPRRLLHHDHARLRADGSITSPSGSTAMAATTA